MYETMTTYEASEIRPEDELFLALSIGEELLVNGAEVSRVEDTISRICTAFGAKRVDVFTITASIIVTMNKGSHSYTQTRRIRKAEYNMERLIALNSLSRKICNHADSTRIANYVEEMEEIRKIKGYGFGWTLLFSVLAAASFSVFFGGDVSDAFCSGIIAGIMRVLLRYLNKIDTNRFLSHLIAAAVAGVLGYLTVNAGIGHSLSAINIGNVMLLIPGLALVNGIRDMFSENLISGIIRTVEALLLAEVIAVAIVWTSVLL